MRRLSLATAAVAACVAVGAILGCGKNAGPALSNVPPDTQLSISIPNLVTSAADSHVVIYRQSMHWWGTDTDGTVVGYQWRILTENLAGLPTDSTAWAFTARTDSTFDFPSPSQRSRAAFEVRAIDNAGAVDPQPVHQDLYLANDAPTATIKRAQLPTTPTLPALRVIWSGRDPQGPASIASYHLWTDLVTEAQGLVIAGKDSFATLGPAFLGRGGGSRKVYVRAIDAGGLSGSVDSVTLPVKAITGRVLLINDNLNKTPALMTNFYVTEMNKALGAGTYTTFTVQPGAPAGSDPALRYASEADSLLQLFDDVVYFREDNAPLTAGSQTLRTMQGGLQSLLKRGGGVYLSGPTVVGTDSSLSCGVRTTPNDVGLFPASGFAKDVLGIGTFRCHILIDRTITYDTNFAFGTTGAGPTLMFLPFVGNTAAGTDTLRMGVFANGTNPSTVFSAEGFAPDSADVASGAVKPLWQIDKAADGTVDAAPSAVPYTVGILSTKLGGKIAYLSYSIALTNNRGNAAAQFQHVLDLIGVVRP